MLGACGGQSDAESPGNVPAGLERFHYQNLAFGSCEGGATTAADARTFANKTFECARLEVPLDCENPGGRKAWIALLRVPSKGEPGKRMGSLLVNPGGPGFSGVSHSVTVAEASAGSPVTAHFDLIGFDPRGVGATTPALHRFTDGEGDANVTLSTLNAGVQDYTEDGTRETCTRSALSAQVARTDPSDSSGAMRS